jgi:hypothetical protein
MHQMMLWPVHLSNSTLWDPLSGKKHGMNKKHIIVKTTSEDAIWDLQEINFMGVMGKNTPIILILSITLFIDRNQINSIGVFLSITLIKFILSQY